MQTPETSIPHWLTSYIGWFVGIIASVIAIYREWSNRNKPGTDIEHTQAVTLRTRAEARQIELQANLSAGDLLLRMSDKLDRVQAMMWESENECKRLQGIEKECARLRKENKALEEKVERYKDTIRKIETGLP